MINSDGRQSKQAIALKYDETSDQAPRVVAKGTGMIAENILTAAKQYGVPIYQNATLSSMLLAIDLDREIPPELYQAVAEVLAHIYRIDRQVGSQRR